MKRFCLPISLGLLSLAWIFVAPRAVCGEDASSVDYDRLHVGEQADGRIVVPTNQVLSPLGEQVGFPARPTAVALSPDGRRLAVLCSNRVLTIDPDTKKIVGNVKHNGSFTGILFDGKGRQLFASTISGTVEVYAVGPEGKLTHRRSIRLTPRAAGGRGGVAPSGLALDPGGKTVWVAYNMANVVGEVDTASGKELRKIPVGNAPYDVAFAAGKLYVSNWAGRIPAKGD
ncbi:MAG TPA: YncE family protein, partial [Thermoguttaceae bacterium]|nr:YncE family protein [Thermoguttaceae bacterium]